MKKEKTQTNNNKSDIMEFSEELPSEENIKKINFEFIPMPNKDKMAKTYFDKVNLKEIKSPEKNKNLDIGWLSLREPQIKENVKKYNKLDYKSTDNFNMNSKENEKNKEKNTIEFKKIKYPEVDLNEIIVKQKDYGFEYSESKIKKILFKLLK